MGSILRKANYQVGFAFNGKQALELLQESIDYDLILLDVNMPVMNGYETCRQIRKRKVLSDIPVIFLTALNEVDNIVKGFEVGGQDYVGKPFNGLELLARVKTHIELRRSREELKKLNTGLESLVEERTSELQQANEDLEAANRELELLDEAKADFLGIISHEINTPLNGIIGFTNILKEKLKHAEFYEMIDFLDMSAKRLEKFAKFSLLITELRTNRKILRYATCQLPDLLDVISQRFRFMMEEKKITVTINSTVESVWADQNLLEKSIECVLDNAIRYSPAGGEILLNTYVEEAWFVIEITDRGRGFEPEILSDPFRLFSYGKDYLDEQKGLSLALVNLILKAHEGSVKLANNEEGGAVVRLCFPEKKEE
ncbi:hybrid sensor histidine kinase/response regulator [Sunxiuqinia elliptica]|uniref:hybrid sensor histidine kinase/response regulator n=1 Tax=Sunxiuqinia elliptica TaxID=655355 RepID=UPI0037DA42A6